jgi:hypothetical protein
MENLTPEVVGPMLEALGVPAEEIGHVSWFVPGNKKRVLGALPGRHP